MDLISDFKSVPALFKVDFVYLNIAAKIYNLIE